MFTQFSLKQPNMWQRRSEDQARARLTLPVISNKQSLVNSSSQLQSSTILKLEDEIVCLGEDISQIPSAVGSSMTNLSLRHMEVGQWQALISESIDQVDREITAVEQVKDVTESYLQERQLYSQLMANCVGISNSLSFAGQRDCVFTELKKEEQMIDEIRELLQNHICMLLSKLSSLKNIRARLLADFQDKREAIKLTTKCISLQLNAPTSPLPATPYKPKHVSYNAWLCHCKELKMAADDLIRESSTFRGNLRFTLTNLKTRQERQRHSTASCMRKRINELSRTQEALIWKRHQIRNEISDLTKDMQKVAGQIRKCDSRMLQDTTRLEILNQRPGFELCLDRPYIGLTLEKRDLAAMAAGCSLVLKNSQNSLVLAEHRLMALENKMAKNAQHLQTQQKCQSLHQSFLPPRGSTVILANRPRLHGATSSTSLSTFTQ
ncbi:uncharacterized protein LOC110956693 isoform X2 [Acanthochromis polyacanthus]|uniref:uncharacterized protein LOC110956693 isoform X1 n=1 Tax=Acanthochromis polyacanthus TaxID=80966 RepID=UPI002233FC02|nr:uncharacterized protein LOC110956693 isoform X1 [Acanthochromis polyacanthus]XP_051811958.1 uncharacterized protein LOC110956693 isoform X2 [Acanthochromis polyacanthus]